MSEFVAVSDTTALRYLIQIGRVDLLGQFFRTILIPPTVAAELTNVSTPYQVRQWVLNPPAWLQIRVPTAVVEFRRVLHAGEQDAIRLARSPDVDFLIMDEKYGHAEATELGLDVLRMLGLLERAFQIGLLDSLDDVVREIRATNFRIRDSQLELLLKRNRGRPS